MANVGRILYQVKRNAVSVLFPTLCGLAIYKDYSHTQSWKKEQLALYLKKEDQKATGFH